MTTDLEAILDGFADPFCAFDRAWRFVYLNRAAEAMLRRTRAELVGAELWVEFPEAVGTRFYREYHRAMAEGVVVAFEAYYPPLEHWAEVRAVPTADGLWLFFRDVTARRRAEDALRFLSAASAHLAGALDAGLTLGAVASLAVPAFADGCTIELLDERGRLSEAATAHDDPAKAEIARELRRRWPPERDPAHPLHEVLATGRSSSAAAVTDDALAASDADEERAALRRALGVRSGMVVPLVAGGRILGAMTFVLGEDRGRYGPQDLEVAEELARRVALALENARLYGAQREAAVTLQRRLLPARLPEVEGLELAARYAPAGSGAEVGGDWYDVVRLPAGRVGVVVGDVAGHSIEAAAVMGQVRTAVRASALEGHGPAGVVERANRFLTASEPDVLATCCYLELDPESGSTTTVRAGHPPPLVVGPDGKASFMEVEAGLPLGVDEEASYVETTVLLHPGAAVVLYTDGLVEGRDRPLADGLECLRAVAEANASSRAPEALADALLAGAAQGPATGDDVALLVVRHEPVVEGAPPAAGQHVSRRFLDEPASVGAARHFVVDVLAEWGQEELADTAALMTSELVTNAVLHTASEFEVALSLGHESLRVEVADGSERLPAPRVADDDAVAGRGLLIVEALATAWGVEPRGAGKAVWAEMALP